MFRPVRPRLAQAPRASVRRRGSENEIKKGVGGQKFKRARFPWYLSKIGGGLPDGLVLGRFPVSRDDFQGHCGPAPPNPRSPDRRPGQTTAEGIFLLH